VPSKGIGSYELPFEGTAAEGAVGAGRFLGKLKMTKGKEMADKKAGTTRDAGCNARKDT